MQALAAGGNHAAALVVYRDLRLLLHREVNAQPNPETHTLFRQIQADLARLNGAGQRPSFPSAAPSIQEPATPAPSHNLPYPTTSFVGRERDMEAIPRLLKKTRLLTITGAGGCGKSRLALEVGHTLRYPTPDGVWSVELASLADPALVPQAVSAALGARERPGEVLIDTLVRFLRPKRLLLLLDNCEHLLPACAALIDALLRDCPHLQVLATSREPLNMPGETTYGIPSLAHGDAVRLFLDRAAAAQPGFDLPGNAESVARICGWLDGIPLAIEMAATRLRALPVETLADRLEDSLRLLTHGNRVALPRHRTLRAMIDWSHDLLSAPEKVLLRRLAVFAGGWTIAAAEAVCGDDVLDLLTMLVDKSLVLYENRKGEWRCRLLEPIRQYAQEHLNASGEELKIRRRHADYYLAFATEAEPHLMSPEAGAWMDRLEREQDNVRAVLGWVVASAASPWGGEAAELGLRLGSALGFYWEDRSVTEGREWLERLLTPSASPARGTVLKRTAVRAGALFLAGKLAWRQGDTHTVKRNFEECLSIGRELEDRSVIASALLGLGSQIHREGGDQEARTIMEESLSIRRELGDRRRIGVCCNSLGCVARDQRDYDRAQALLEESLTLFLELDNDVDAVHPLLNLGILQIVRGDYPGARAYLQQGISIAQDIGLPRDLASASCCLGTVARLEGNLETSHARYRESTRLHQRQGDRPELMGCLVGLACTSAAIGEQALRTDEETESLRARSWWVRGARLFGAAEALCEANTWRLRPDHLIDRERWVAAARAALGEEAFAATWAEGRALSLDEACDLALAEEGAENLTTVRPGKSP
jgi:non-specific serine/threonine protein kinase